MTTNMYSLCPVLPGVSSFFILAILGGGLGY